MTEPHDSSEKQCYNTLKKILSEILSQASMQSSENKKMQGLIAPQRVDFIMLKHDQMKSFEGRSSGCAGQPPHLVSEASGQAAVTGEAGQLHRGAQRSSSQCYLQLHAPTTPGGNIQSTVATASNKAFPDGGAGRVRLLAPHSSTSHAFAGLMQRRVLKDFNTVLINTIMFPPNFLMCSKMY